MDDTISRRAAIDALHDEIVRRRIDEDTNDDGALDEFDTEEILRQLPSAQSDLITQMQNGIKATDADDAYSCGIRNGMRWCMSLIDDKEPLYENCPSAQPEIIRCKECENWDKSWTNDWEPNCHYCPMIDRVCGENWYCADAERREE